MALKSLWCEDFLSLEIAHDVDRGCRGQAPLIGRHFGSRHCLASVGRVFHDVALVFLLEPLAFGENPLVASVE